jgi:hypothetical protein
MTQSAVFLAANAPAAPVGMMPIAAIAFDRLADGDRQWGSFTGEVALAAHRIARVAAVPTRRLDRDGGVRAWLLARRWCRRSSASVLVLGPSYGEEQPYRYYY